MTDKTITISDAALIQVKKQLSKRDNPNGALRLGVRGGGCSGFSYALMFEDNEPSAKDLVFEFDGVKVFVDKKSIIYLNGCILEWEKTLMYQGFKFVNPNEASKCGCGHSFAV